MTQVVATDLLDSYSPAQLDEVVNTLAVSYLSFATLSGYNQAMYGIRLGESTNPTNTFLANGCIKRALLRTLLAVQQETENKVGYTLTERFHEQTIPLSESYRFRLQYPGVEAVEVSRKWTSVATYPISPLYLSNVTVIFQGASYYAQVPQSLVTNPDDIILRNSVDNGTYQINKSPAVYPKTSGGNWLLQIDPRTRPYQVGDVVNVQHARFVRWTVPKPVGLPQNAKLEVVYPGTYQILKQAAPVVDDGSNLTFTLYVWELIAPDFIDAEVDLLKANGDFYKLYTSLTLAYQEQVYSPMEFIVTDGTFQKIYKHDVNDATKLYMNVALTDHQYGICHVEASEDLYDLLVQDFPELSHYTPSQISIKISYKTSPVYLAEKLRNQIPSLIGVIIQRVAADLPVSECGCEEGPYLKAQRKPYGAAYINPTTGVEVYKSEYGSAHGFVAWKRAVESAMTFKPAVLIGTRLHYDDYGAPQTPRKRPERRSTRFHG